MTEIVNRTADVLVVGGGPAATWAALSASRDGADVVVVDKVYCGTSGYLAHNRWSYRVLDGTYYRNDGLATDARFPDAGR